MRQQNKLTKLSPHIQVIAGIGTEMSQKVGRNTIELMISPPAHLIHSLTHNDQNNISYQLKNNHVRGFSVSLTQKHLVTIEGVYAIRSLCDNYIKHLLLRQF